MQKIITVFLFMLLSCALAHASGVLITPKPAANSYTDTAAAITLAAAEDYTDSAITALDNATIVRDAAIANMAETDAANTFTEPQTFDEPATINELRYENNVVFPHAVESAYAFHAPLRTSLTPAVGAGAFTYSRATTATFEDYQGIVRTAAINAPRFSGARYDSLTGRFFATDENGEYIRTTPAYEHGILTIGDSLSRGYPNYLSALLSQNFIKAAVGGTCLTPGSDGICAESADYIEGQLDANLVDGMDCVIVNGGFNDLNAINGTTITSTVVLPKIKAAMGRIIGKIQDAGAVPIVIGMTPSETYLAGAANGADKIVARRAFNIWLRAYCESVGAEFIDAEFVLGSETDQTQLSDPSVGDDYRLFARDDGLHITSLGERTLAEQIYEQVLKRSYIKGLYLEGDSTNLALYSEDFSNEVWADTDVTVTEEVTTVAPDGAAGCYSLTATDAEGTLIQDLGDIAETKYTFSVWMKRKTGTGRVFLTLNGGTSYSAVYLDTEWRRVWLNTGTTSPNNADGLITHVNLDNPDVGIMIQTSGDAVYVWGAQAEALPWPTSYIATTDTATLREQDVLSMSITGVVGTAASSAGAAFYTLTPEWCGAEAGASAVQKNVFEASGTVARLYSAFVVGAGNGDLYGSRSTATASAQPLLKSGTYYMISDVAGSIGAQSSGIARGQVIPVGFWWGSGSTPTYGAYQYGDLYRSGTGTAANDIGTTLYFNRRNTSADDRWLYGHLRDLIFNTAVLSDSESNRLTLPVKYTVQ